MSIPKSPAEVTPTWFVEHLGWNVTDVQIHEIGAGIGVADMWEKYRIASMFCLVYPAVASRGMDLDVPRERDLANVMLSRQARAAVDLDWVSLLP